MYLMWCLLITYFLPFYVIYFCYGYRSIRSKIYSLHEAGTFSRKYGCLSGSLDNWGIAQCHTLINISDHKTV